MEVPFFNLSKQYEQLKSLVDPKIQEICSSGSFVLGPEVGNFERRCCEYLGVSHADGVASGTSALFLALKSLGVGPGDEVIVPVNTFIATAFAVSQTGARPIFVDCDLYYNINVSLLEQALTSKTTAIIAVHLYGQAANMKYITAFAEHNKLFVVEDFAQAFGATLEGCPVGSLGDVGCTSFYPGKNLGGYGDGGLVATDIDSVSTGIRCFRNQGIVEKYEHLELGYNSRLDAIHAAVLNIKLDFIDEWNQRRRRIAKIYDTGLSAVIGGMNIETPEVAPCNSHVYHQYVILLKNSFISKRNEIQDRLLKKFDVQTGLHYPKLIVEQPCYSDRNLMPCAFTRAYDVSRRMISLPIYPELTDRQAEHVISSLYSVLSTV